MQKFYPTVVGKLCLALSFVCLFSTISHAQIRTYDTTFDGWNAIVTEDLSLHGNDSAPGIVFFPGIGQQDKNINDLKVNGPHYLISNGMWDGSVPLGNGVHHPFIISLQPPTWDNPAFYVKPKIDAILARYRIKRRSFYMTGLSLGGWQANEFVTYQPTPGDRTYGNMVRAIVNLEGVEPADYTGIYAGIAYPGKMGDWAQNCGGRELWVEGQQDWRDMLAGAQNMMNAVPGSATYFQVTYGGGAHCCWNTEYDPNTTWSKSNNNISQIVGNQVPMNVWQWLLRQGDTSMPGGASAPPPPPAAVGPTANAGQSQAITLPTNSVNLNGSGGVYNGATVSAASWEQTAGPNKANLKPGNLVSVVMNTVANVFDAVSGTSVNLDATASGLVQGFYTFQLTVKDNNGKVSTSAVNVTVNAKPTTAPTPPPAPPPPSTPPNVSAGGDPTITLPVTTTTLNGWAAGSNGAKIASILWQETQGPVTAKISSPSSLSTAISGLTAAGTYVFRMTVTDQNGKQAASSVNVVVEPAVVAAAPPTVNAGGNQTITLPTNSVTLNGKASGNDGAIVNSYFWNLVSGPSWVKFANEWALSTTVDGLVAGTYVFQLSVSDTHGKTSTSEVTVTVKAAGNEGGNGQGNGNGQGDGSKTPPTVSAGKGQTITLPTSSVELSGAAAGANGAKIVVISWAQETGPEKAKIASPASLKTEVTGMTKAGTYIYKLTVIDNNGKSANGSMTVWVDAGAVKTPPTVSAGGNQTIMLPTNSVTLKGEATGHDGAVVNSYYWEMVSGPSWVKFGNEWAATTEVSDLIAGTYEFRLLASDNNLETTTSAPVTVVVKPKATGDGMGTGVEAGEASTIGDSGHTSGLVMYPNPVHDLLNIQVNNIVKGKVIVAIYNMKGVRVQTLQLEKESWSLPTSVDVSRLAAGVYVIEVTSGAPALRMVDKFIKQQD